MNASQNHTDDAPAKYPWLWDTEDDNARFEAVLSSAGVLSGPLGRQKASLVDYDSSSDVKRPLQKRGGISMADTRRAMARLIDYAPESEIERLLPLQGLVELWPEIAGRIRSETKKAEMEKLYQRLKRSGNAYD